MAKRVVRLPKLARRNTRSHKGNFGRILVIAGSPGLTGAGVMAAVAAQRTGGGLVTVAVPESLHHIYEFKLTSCMSMPLPEPEKPVLGPAGAENVLAEASKYDVMAIGPGLGGAPETAEAVRKLVRELTMPVVVDADGLNAVADDVRCLGEAAGERLLTPHPGEMARMIGAESPAEVQANREGVALQFAQKHGVLLALKGHQTVVTDGARLYVNPTGNPGMATGGTGDVLTGMVTGLRCQGLDGFDALQLAVFAHGLAGDYAAQDLGQVAMVPEDMLARMPAAFQALRRLRGVSDAVQAAAHAMGQHRAE